MTELLKRHRLLFTTLALVIFGCQLTSLSNSYPGLPRFGGWLINSILSPVEVLHREMSLSVRDYWRHYVWLRNVALDRDRLQERINALEDQNSLLVEFKHENDRLKQLLSFQQESGRRGIVASLVGRDPSNWLQTITIDRGSSDGLRAGLPVVDGNAIVGQVILVNATTSKVLLLTDTTSAIDAIVQGSRAQGIIEGAAPDRRLKFRFVLDEYPVNPGDRIIASGLDGVFPKGALVGVVTHVAQGSTGMLQNIEVQPSTDPNRLEDVLVVLPEDRSVAREAATSAGTEPPPARASAKESNG